MEWNCTANDMLNHHNVHIIGGRMVKSSAFTAESNAEMLNLDGLMNSLETIL
jgi:hypothetical protein